MQAVSSKSNGCPMTKFLGFYKGCT